MLLFRCIDALFAFFGAMPASFFRLKAVPHGVPLLLGYWPSHSSLSCETAPWAGVIIEALFWWRFDYDWLFALFHELYCLFLLPARL